MQGRKLLRLLLLFLPCENKCQESVAHWFGINNEIPCHCLFAFARALTSLDTTGGLKEESRKKHGTLFFFYFFMRICVSIPVSTCSANNENEEVHHGSILADVVATGDMTTTVKETRREDLPFTRFSHSSPSSSPFVILFFFLFRWGRPRVCVWINNRFFIFFFFTLVPWLFSSLGWSRWCHHARTHCLMSARFTRVQICYSFNSSVVAICRRAICGRVEAVSLSNQRTTTRTTSLVAPAPPSATSCTPSGNRIHSISRYQDQAAILFRLLQVSTDVISPILSFSLKKTEKKEYCFVLRTPTVDKATSDGRRAHFSHTAYCFSAKKKAQQHLHLIKSPPGSTPGWQRKWRRRRFFYLFIFF